MRHQFTTVSDVTAYLVELDQAFSDEITEDEMRDIVRQHSAGRYEDITEAELDAMIVAAYVAVGADETTARQMLTNA